MTTTKDIQREKTLERLNLSSLSECRNKGGNMPTDNKVKKTPLTREDYNEQVELWTLKFEGDEEKAKKKVSEKFRIKGEKGGLYAEFCTKYEGETDESGELTDNAKVVHFFKVTMNGKTHYEGERDNSDIDYTMRFNGANHKEEGETAK